MDYRAKEFDLAHTPCSLNAWLSQNPNVEIISTYPAGRFVGIIYKESAKTELDQPTTLETDFFYSSPDVPFIQYAPPRLIDWDEIEKALGFKLFYWQKTFLQGQGFRHFGKTVATILHDLLVGNTDSTSIDLTNLKPTDQYKIKIYKNFHDRLTRAGIPCRELKLPQRRM